MYYLCNQNVFGNETNNAMAYSSNDDGRRLVCLLSVRKHESVKAFVFPVARCKSH